MTDFHPVEHGAPTAPVAARLTPLPVPATERQAWRVACLLLALRSSHGRSSTIEQLHVLFWALRSEENGRRLSAAWEDAPGSIRVLRAFEPHLEETLTIAREAGLIEQRANGRQALTDLGARVVDRIRDEEDLMDAEKQRLAGLGQISTSQMWQRLGTPSRITPTQEALDL